MTKILKFEKPIVDQLDALLGSNYFALSYSEDGGFQFLFGKDLSYADFVAAMEIAKLQFTLGVLDESDD